MYGDRSHPIHDQTRPGKYLTVKQFPEMVRYKARFIGQEKKDEYPTVEIVTPEGKVLEWGNKQFIKRGCKGTYLLLLSCFENYSVRMFQCDAGTMFLCFVGNRNSWLRNMFSEYRPKTIHAKLPRTPARNAEIHREDVTRQLFPYLSNPQSRTYPYEIGKH